MNSQGPQQHSITEAAADWAVRLHAGALTDQEQAELCQWIARDSRHEAALRFAEQTWAALGEVHKDEPVHRQRPAAASMPVRRSKRRRPWQRAAAVALVVVVAGVGWLRGPDVVLRLQADYVTQKGEVRTVQLADGSQVELDSDSAIRLEYDGVQRRVSLIQGSAIFDVAPMGGQETRPFVVQSAGGQTRALGTRFVVAREDDSQAWVGMLAHSVEISLPTHPKKGAAARVLKERQAARYSSQEGIVPLDQFDVERATSWRRGVLIFDRQPLAKVIEQLNHYRPGRVVLTHSDLGEREVSGVFRLDMLDTALATLTQELQVQRLDLAGLSLIY
ncbi:FecR family protein [Pseudomonas poae]|uniref:Siderophore-interacting protein n=1 Tax=Pseudomonas poae TaxID=200451 RepID=A0A2S9EAU5_9PSED|nr:FecR family protein [Pseudomonas poae]PRA22483.1 siderophore-interacting protein [Pseudomonas poae]PRC12045.1 siderophore-interacting protein [Pseudomonas poae]